jgi:hypothetical protein
MSGWTDEELRSIGGAEELRLAFAHENGALSRYVTMWVVRCGDQLYVRSAGGLERPWYRHVVASGEGRIRAGGVERNVTFAEAPADAHADIDVAYHHKYDRYGADIVGHVTGPRAQLATIRLVAEGLS